MTSCDHVSTTGHVTDTENEAGLSAGHSGSAVSATTNNASHLGSTRAAETQLIQHTWRHDDYCCDVTDPMMTSRGEHEMEGKSPAAGAVSGFVKSHARTSQSGSAAMTQHKIELRQRHMQQQQLMTSSTRRTSQLSQTLRNNLERLLQRGLEGRGLETGRGLVHQDDEPTRSGRHDVINTSEPRDEAEHSALQPGTPSHLGRFDVTRS